VTRPPRVLVPTDRGWYPHLAHCVAMGLEDAMCAVADADLLHLPAHAVRPGLGSLRRVKRVRPPRERYDLGFFAAMSPSWVRSLRFVEELRDRCDQVAVYIFDSWPSQTRPFRLYRRQWSLVDKVFVSYPEAVEAYADLVECPVEYLPQAVEPKLFHPYRDQRPIEILSVGRRLEATHRQLLELASKDDLFYHFTEADTCWAHDLDDSRALLGRLSQSARLQVCWPVEITTPARAGGISPVTARWFEAAASGSLILGSRPRAAEFDRLFPYADLVHELDPASPTELERTVRSALSRWEEQRSELRALAEDIHARHSWTRRCATILESLGLEEREQVAPGPVASARA
jgi:glycosyl transferase family 1